MMYITSISAALISVALFGQYSRAAENPSMIEAIHQDVWNRFVHKPQYLVLDYTDLNGAVIMPEPAECAVNKPNALSWGTPIEDGPFFTGLYLDGMVRRWKRTQSEDDRQKASHLAQGLLRCASVGKTPGFIARWVLDDQVSHYSVGSDDQSGPWFYGLWKYVKSGAATPEEKERIVGKMKEVAQALRANKWDLPSDPQGDFPPGETRGWANWSSISYRSATRLLFMMRIMQELTGDKAWGDLYSAALQERAKSGHTRLQVVEEGMAGEWREVPQLAKTHLYICVVSQLMVRDLADLETNAEVKKSYLKSLAATAEAAWPTLPGERVASFTDHPFLLNWRTMNEMWRPQKSAQEAVKLAGEQLNTFGNRGRYLEVDHIREPICAVWLSLLHPAGLHPRVQNLSKLIEQVNWKTVHCSFAFMAESAWYLLQETPGVILPPSALKASSFANVTVRPFDEKAQRTSDQNRFTVVPPEFKKQTLYTVARGSNKQPGKGFTVVAAKESTAWLLVMKKGDFDPESSWELTDLIVRWTPGTDIFTDRVFQRTVKAGEQIVVPEATGLDASGNYAIPHALVLEEK